MRHDKNTQSKEYLFLFEIQDEFSNDQMGFNFIHSSSGEFSAVKSDTPRKYATNGGASNNSVTKEEGSHSRLILSLLKRMDDQSKVFIYLFILFCSVASIGTLKRKCRFIFLKIVTSISQFNERFPS